MKKPRTSLPFEAWPEIDRLRWSQAISKGGFLEPDGHAAHWAEATKIQVQKGYAKFLFFLDKQCNLGKEHALDPQSRISKERIHAYGTWLIDQGLSSVTCTSRMTDLCEAIRVMCPGSDLSAMKDAISKLQKRSSPSRQKHTKIMHPQEIWRRLADEMTCLAQEAGEHPSLLQACAYRDHMAFGFLAVRPIRLRNLTQLTLGKQLTHDVLGWHCHFESHETKDHNVLLFDLPTDPEFVELFTLYLKRFRPVLLSRTIKTEDLTGPLWLSTRRRAMSQQSLYWNICRLSEKLFGHRINPHLLRDCAASAISSDTPEHVMVASRVLGHSSLNTTIMHYEQSSMLIALGRLGDQIHALQIEELENEQESDIFALPFNLFDDEAA